MEIDKNRYKGETIVWLNKETEVGRAPLPEKSFGEERRQLAYENNIEEYDDFLFLDKDGKTRMHGNKMFFKDVPAGKFCGVEYTFLKSKLDADNGIGYTTITTNL